MILKVLCNKRQKAIQHIVGPKGALYMTWVESPVKFFETINAQCRQKSAAPSPTLLYNDFGSTLQRMAESYPAYFRTKKCSMYDLS